MNKKNSSLFFFCAFIACFVYGAGEVNKESFVEAPPVAGDQVDDEKRDRVMEQFIEQYEVFVRLCTRLTREIATMQDTQLKKVHKVFAQGDSLSVKNLEALLGQLKHRVQQLENCVAHAMKG